MLEQTHMASHKILCVISIVARADAQIQSYTTKDQGEFCGLQTNEAPVKYLMSRVDEGTPVEILCITSREAKMATTILGEVISPMDYFARQVLLDDGGRHPLVFTEIPQHPGESEEAIAATADRLNPGDVVDIDTTGGSRDGVSLLMLVVQLMRYKNVQLGTAVYTNYQERSIQIQDDTYQILGLINAMNEFTENGKADQLSRYFKDSRVTNVKQLLGNMMRFSSDIALCRANAIVGSVKRVNHRIDLLEQTDPEQLNTLSERMLQKLLPTLRQQFVATDINEHIMNLNLIQWCTKRHLVIQALALYRETIPMCMIGLGMFSFSQEFLEQCRAAFPRASESQLIGNAFLTVIHGGANRVPSPQHRKVDLDVLAHPIQTIDPTKVSIQIPEATASRLLFFFHQICTIRNRTVHLDEGYAYLPYAVRERMRQLCLANFVSQDLSQLTLDGICTYLRGGIRAIRTAAELVPPSEPQPSDEALE